MFVGSVIESRLNEISLFFILPKPRCTKTETNVLKVHIM